MSLLVSIAFARPLADPVLARIQPRLLQAAGPVTVVVEGDDPLGLAELLVEQGLAAFAAGPWVQVEVFPDELLELAAQPGVRRVRAPHRASPKEESEGVEAVLVEDWRLEGQTGEGVRIAIVDVGFDGWEALVGSELPDGIVDHTDGATLGSRHGAAVAEVIHDIAPDAELSFHAFSTDVEFVRLLEELAEDPPDLVNASIGFDNVAPIDGTSAFAQAVDALADEKVLYIGAAGNEAEKYAHGALTDTDEDGWAELDGLETIQIWATGGTAKARLRWSEPFGEAGVDVDLYLYDDEDGELGASVAAQNGTGDPFEEVEAATGTGVSAFARFKIEEGSVEGLDAWLYSPAGMHSEALNPEMSLTLPADAEGCLAVGAWVVDDEVLAAYSSHGPTEDGRLKPELVAPTEVSTTTFGSGTFSGSSAAAPHVTGVAALLVDRKERARPKTLRKLLFERALDVGDPGEDDQTGHGLVQATDLPCGCASTPAASLAWLWATLFAWRRRCSS